jgi:SAM-dependent methyltransferase
MRRAITNSVPSLLARGRRALDRTEVPYWRRKYSSPALLGLYSKLVPRLVANARGVLLDVGCGTMPFRRFVDGRSAVTEYHGVDVELRGPGVTLISGVDRMEGIGDETCEIVLCTEVLEHVSDPGSALAEISRVLKDNGVLLLSVPFLARLHEEPHDYFRYTEHGLRYLLMQHGFSVREIVPTGSLFSFLGHQIASVALATTGQIPLLRDVVFWINALLVVIPCQMVDRWLLPARMLPLGYVVVAEKHEY